MRRADIQELRKLAFLSDQAYTGQVEETVHRVEKREYGPIPGLSSQFGDERRLGRCGVQFAAVDSENASTRLLEDGFHHGRLATTLRSM